ncbi:DegT/DnrJ/EryC1/StrS family aminotransferase [Thermodesulfobacteriota bacterium]
MIQHNSKLKKRMYLSPPHMSGEEIQFVTQAFQSNYIAPLGPMVDAFEKEFAEYIGIEHCVALCSGTSAVHLALRNIDLSPGDEVFASTLTFIGSVSPIIFESAKPVFIDSDRRSWNMDPALLEQEFEQCEKKGKLPKAVIPTDLYGQCADYGRIFEICERFDVPVIVDAAEALGSRYNSDTRLSASDSWNHAGRGAKAAIYSFNGNKIITTSGGGMLASNDKELIDNARKLSQQAREDFIHYEHEEIGYNYRMSNILAAIGRGQLKVLDKRVEKKRKLFEYYKNSLKATPGIEFMPEAPYGKSNRWLTVILVTPEEFGVDRETVRLALEMANIESRPVWKPMHMQPVFQVEKSGLRNMEQSGKKRHKAKVVGGEIAEDLFNRGLCLPSGTGMNEEDLDRVIDVIRKCKK